MADDDSAASKPIRFAIKVLDELGLVSLYNSTPDTLLLCMQRFVRLFAYGGTTLILVSYLAALGIPDSEIGLFMTLTLVGDVAISFFLTLVADRLGRRAIISLGATLMIASGVVFGLCDNFWVLLVAAIFGVISPNGNEIGPFRAIEESTLAYLTPPKSRPDIFAWYALVGTAGQAFGMMACGWALHSLQSNHEWTEIRADSTIFLAYAALGCVILILTLLLSDKVEIKEEPAPNRDQETTPLLSSDQTTSEPSKEKRALLPQISNESRKIMLKLSLFLAVDAFASSMASLSWVTNFFKRKFHLEEGYLGSLFFTTTILSAFLILLAASISRRFGNLNTMAYTQLPGAIALACMGLTNNLPLAMVLVLIRVGTVYMDFAPRSAFLSAVMLPNELTAVMGFINVVRTMAQSLGPLVTGVLAENRLFWLAFLIAGCLKGGYDLALVVAFAGYESRSRKEREDEEEEEERLAVAAAHPNTPI